MNSLYERLGVGREATTDEIYYAYRRKRSETHPDKGGNESDFKNVITAYEVLSDPEQRKTYDETGRYKNHETKEDVVNKKIFTVYNSYMQFLVNKEFDFENCDAIAECRKMAERDVKECESNIRDMIRLLKSFKKMRKRTTGGSNNNLFMFFIEDSERNLFNKIIEQRRNIQIARKSRDFLKELKQEMPTESRIRKSDEFEERQKRIAEILMRMEQAT